MSSPRRKMKHSLRKQAKRKLELRVGIHCCHRCGTVVGLTVHHIVPVAEGGTSDLDNLIVLCDPCHAAEHLEDTS